MCAENYAAAVFGSHRHDAVDLVGVGETEYLLAEAVIQHAEEALCCNKLTTAKLLKCLYGPLSLHAEILTFKISTTNVTIGEGPCLGKIGRNVLNKEAVVPQRITVSALHGFRLSTHASQYKLERIYIRYSFLSTLC